MKLAQRVTARLARPDDPRSFSARARSRRWERFAQMFPDITAMQVLDLGGTPDFWMSAPQRPAWVTLVNLWAFHDVPGLLTAVQGDACNPPPALRNARYDLVVSNSLVEHVGGHAQRVRLADVIHGAADRHWVQTPYRYFPVEPHWLCPGIQVLPFAARVMVTKRWPLGHMRPTEEITAVQRVQEVELLSKTELQAYFPESKLWFERFAGLPKSLVAVRA